MSHPSRPAVVLAWALGACTQAVALPDRIASDASTDVRPDEPPPPDVVATDVPATDAGTGDPYVRFDPAAMTWAMGTARIEKRLSLHDGVFAMDGLTNRLDGRELLQDGQHGVEFQIVVDEVVENGASGHWTLDAQRTTAGALGSLALDLTLHDATLTVALHYVLYPGSGVIEQAISYTNRTSAPLAVHDAEIADTNFLADDLAAGHVTFDWFNGGHNEPGALQPQHRVVGPGWTANLQSTLYGDDEVMPEVVFRDTMHGDGVLLGWSYTGAWFTGFHADGRQQVDANGTNGTTLAPGATDTMPVAHLMVFLGDLDDAGNALKDFQYQFKWDLARTDWQGGVKPYIYDRNALDPASTFAATQAFREVGADIWHVDEGWEGSIGGWNDATGTHLDQLRAFADRNALATMIWLPVWYVDPASDVARSHPDWLLNRVNLRFTTPAAFSWMQDLLDTRTTQFGPDWIWRQDGCNGAWGFGDIDQLVASSKYFELMATFLARHPRSAINVNQCGGYEMSLETVHYSLLEQTTDGAAGHFAAYSPSYFYPPDKLWGVVRDDGRNIGWAASRTDLRASLTMAWQWDGSGTPTSAQLEAFRYNADLYHYMMHVGLAGRGAHVFHPDRVERDDPTCYVQRMSADGTRGVIIPMHDHHDDGFVMVHPKGLDRNATYVLRFQNSGLQVSNTGAYWMDQGIGEVDWGGDLVWLNVTSFPGAHTDTTAPHAPTHVQTRAASYLGRSGVEVTWTAGTDENWVSYHEVLHNGAPVGRAPRASYVFVADGAATDRYEVRAVDGDGNASPATAAAP